MAGDQERDATPPRDSGADRPLMGKPDAGPSTATGTGTATGTDTGAATAPTTGTDAATATSDWTAEHVVWDVLVVGAGPAGSSAARAAAEAGASVLLLDRAAFPRYKTCGGGLLGESLRLLPATVRDTIESRVADTVFTQRFRRTFRLRRQAAYLAMVTRADFDQALADAARTAGARFIDGVTVRSIQAPDAAPPLVTSATPTGDSSPESAGPTSGAGERPGDSAGERLGEEAPVLVATSRGTVAARVVIGADGAGGRVGRWVGVDIAAVDLGLEDEVAMPSDGTPWRDRVLLDWGGASGSYAWVFPKRDSLTVGVIQRRGAPDETRAYLAAWRSHLGLDEGRETTLHSSGHLTQWRRPGSPVRRGRVLVAGDTAGLLEPWTREGISFALRSGTWAGTAAAQTARAATLRAT
ncbi:MAG: geranylgeranyl reductase family protein, partial [Herbiconiux sp.]|nr:geranylgeranyl reductase family protein [Herbiconiux sp.]